MEWDAYRGAHRVNYRSAVEHSEEVSRVLLDQERRGQIVSYPEEEAKRRYGDRLTIASLGAIEKGVREDGTVEVRVIHDGTHGLRINSQVKVRDAGLAPSAQDLAVVLRECEGSLMPFFGLTADVEEAHRAVALHPDDWPLVACQVRPGERVYLNKRGTFGIASAAYWWGRLGSATVRALQYVIGRDSAYWLLLFADDYLMLAGGTQFADLIVGSLLLLR
eukprot:4202524-Amphidinium_carterae.1